MKPLEEGAPYIQNKSTTIGVKNQRAYHFSWLNRKSHFGVPQELKNIESCTLRNSTWHLKTICTLWLFNIAMENGP